MSILRSQILADAVASNTRSDFLQAAKRLFAERGFYGTSIAQIAAELGLTKQALIHHFGTKERLYGEVLSNMAEELSHVVDEARVTAPDPERQLEELLLTLYGNLFDNPQGTQLLMRELLDNPPRAEHAHSWYLKGFLDSVVAMVRSSLKGKALTEAEALARAYLVLGAINYVAISEVTLRRMYPHARGLKDQFRSEIQHLVRTYLG